MVETREGKGGDPGSHLQSLITGDAMHGLTSVTRGLADILPCTSRAAVESTRKGQLVQLMD